MKSSSNHSEECLECELSLASINGDENIVSELLTKNVDVNSKSPCNTALFDAIRNEHPNIVKMLIENGADVNQPNPDDGSTPLDSAFEHPNHEIIETLVKAGANTAAISPVEIARRSDSPETFKILGNIEVNLNFQESDSKRTALHECAMYGYINSLKVLLGSGADVTIADAWGNTASNLARTNKHFEILELLDAAEKSA